MTEIMYILTGLVVGVFLITLVALARNKNLTQNLVLPRGGGSHTKTTDRLSAEAKGQKDNARVIASRDQLSGVDFGQQNEFGGSIGDVAGRDIVKGAITSTKKSETEETSSRVDFGRGNKFTGSVGDIAGRDILKDEDSNQKASGDPNLKMN